MKVAGSTTMVWGSENAPSSRTDDRSKPRAPDARWTMEAGCIPFGRRGYQPPPPDQGRVPEAQESGIAANIMRAARGYFDSAIGYIPRHFELRGLAALAVELKAIQSRASIHHASWNQSDKSRDAFYTLRVGMAIASNALDRIEAELAAVPSNDPAVQRQAQEHLDEVLRLQSRVAQIVTEGLADVSNRLRCAVLSTLSALIDRAQGGGAVGPIVAEANALLEGVCGEYDLMIAMHRDEISAMVFKLKRVAAAARAREGVRA